MDDYSVESLSESKNEWCARLINILTPAITNEFKLIFKDALNVCIDNNEEDKYLMTFQVYLSGIPKWNKTMVDNSAKRAVEFTRCSYLEDLITCIHVIQLKALSCVRVCQKQKKVDINIPSIDIFLHRVYSNVARKVYMNIYLYERDISPLQIQKNNRELEYIIKECILNTIRETMPIETILRSYMDETEEQTVIVREELATPSHNKNSDTPINANSSVNANANSTTSVNVNATTISANANATTSANSTLENESNKDVLAEENKIIQTLDSIKEQPQEAIVKMNMNNIEQDLNTKSSKPNSLHVKSVGFSDTDYTMDENGNEATLEAPKTIQRLEQLSLEKQMNKMNEINNDSGEDDKLIIGNDINLDFDIIEELDEPTRNKSLLDEIEILEL